MNTIPNAILLACLRAQYRLAMKASLRAAAHEGSVEESEYYEGQMDALTTVGTRLGVINDRSQLE